MRGCRTGAERTEAHVFCGIVDGFDNYPFGIVHGLYSCFTADKIYIKRVSELGVSVPKIARKMSRAS